MNGKVNQFGRPVIACEICGTDTPMLGTRRCDPCWELESRIKRHPDRTKKILDSLVSRRPDTDEECRFHNPGA